MSEQIKLSINTAYTSIDQNQRKEAEQYLHATEEQDSTFCFTLISIFEETNPTLQYYTIIHLKNTLRRKWVAYITPFGSVKKIPYFQDSQKNAIKERILQLYCLQQSPQLKPEILLIILDISKFDYPFRYPSLLKYINEQLDQGAHQDQNFVQLLKCLFKQMQKLQSKNEQYNLLWNKIAQIWVQAQNLDPKIQLQLDQVFTNFLLSYNQSVFQDQITQIFTVILQRVAYLFQQQIQLYQENIIHLIKKLSALLNFYQFFIQDPLKDYLQLLIICLNQNSTKLIKTALIASIKFFKVKPFFLNEDQWQNSLKNKNDQQIAEINILRDKINPIIKQFFENESRNLLQRLLSLLNTSNEIGIEDMIEQEEENDFDQLIHPKQAEIFSLALIAAEQLILKSPLITSQLLQHYVDESIKVNFQINPTILESLLIIIGLIPKIQQKVQVQFNIKYDQIFQFLQQSPNLSHKRRLAVLLNRLILLLDQNQMISSLQTAGQLLQTSQDSIIQFQSLMSIKSVVTNYQGNLQWSTILVTICPYIVQLLKGFTRTTIISPLLDLLIKLIEKCQNEPHEIIAKAIENSGLFQLMQARYQETEQNQLIIEQVCQMIKTLIVAYPIGSAIPHLFSMAITLISNNITSKQACIYSLLLFTLQEYESEKSFQLQQLTNLILTNIDVLQSQTDHNIQCLILQIYEELYLLNIFTINDLQSHIPFLEVRYASNKTDVKNAVLGTTTTMMLLLINIQKNNDVVMFQGLIQLILNDFLSPEMTDKLETKFRIELQIISILNRFIILAKDGYIQYLYQNNISIEQYFNCWMKKSNILESEKSIKLNIIAILLIIDYIPPQLFVLHVNQISQQYVRYVQKSQNQRKASQNLPSQRLWQYRSSSRKDQLRNTQMYNESNIQQFFSEVMRNYVMKNQLQTEPTVAQSLQTLI